MNEYFPGPIQKSNPLFLATRSQRVINREMNNWNLIDDSLRLFRKGYEILSVDVWSPTPEQTSL